MNLMFELSKEHINLPKNEILSCLKSEKISYNILESNENVLLIRTKLETKHWDTRRVQMYSRT